MMIEVMPNAFPQVQGGKLRGLARHDREALAAYARHSDHGRIRRADFVVTAWDALFAPRGTPKPIIDTLNAAVRKALADPQLKEALLARGAEPVPGTPEEFGQHVGSEVTRWGKLVKELGRGDRLSLRHMARFGDQVAKARLLHAEGRRRSDCCSRAPRPATFRRPCADGCLEYAEQSAHLYKERKRPAQFVRVEPAPKEQPPRKLSGKRTALRFNTLESGARCSRRRCKSKAGPR